MINDNNAVIDRNNNTKSEADAKKAIQDRAGNDSSKKSSKVVKTVAKWERQ